MRHRLLPLVALLALAPLSPARADGTTLSLSETATVLTPPDELASGLRAEAVAPSAAEAQRAVNVAMADALARVGAVAGVSASTGGYGVFRDAAARPEHWQASQTLALRSGDGAKLLTLVGALQQKGLALDDLHWQLSDDMERKAHAEALRRAIAALRARVDDAARLLGLRFIRFQTVRLDAPRPLRPAMRMMAPAAEPTPPSAVAQDVPVVATVDADVALAPR